MRWQSNAAKGITTAIGASLDVSILRAKSSSKTIKNQHNKKSP